MWLLLLTLLRGWILGLRLCWRLIRLRIMFTLGIGRLFLTFPLIGTSALFRGYGTSTIRRGG